MEGSLPLARMGAVDFVEPVSCWTLDGFSLYTGGARRGFYDDISYGFTNLESAASGQLHLVEKEVNFMKPVLRGEIYSAVLDNIVGSEQAGYRPVLILQSDRLNQNSPTVIVAPITSIIKHTFFQAHCILPLDSPLPERSMVLAEQIRAIDRQRLENYIGRLQAKEMRRVEQAMCYSLGLLE